jgi:hypothetical protein
VCVCDFFKLLRQKSTQTLRHFSFVFFFWRQFLRVPFFVSRVPQQFRQSSCWTCFFRARFPSQGSTRPSLGSLTPTDSRPVLLVMLYTAGVRRVSEAAPNPSGYHVGNPCSPQHSKTRFQHIPTFMKNKKQIGTRLLYITMVCIF